MSRKYYTVNEVINFFGKHDTNITMEDIACYVREKLIHPIIYIDSFPVYACEEGNEGQAVAMGLCFLSAYWDVGNEILGVVDNLARNGKVQTAVIVKKEQLIDQPTIMSWNNRQSALAELPLKFTNPKDYSDDIEIKYFAFPEKNPFFVDVRNLCISTQDFDLLKNFFLINDVADMGFSGFTRDDNSKSKIEEETQLNEPAPEKRINELHEVIERTFNVEKVRLGRVPTSTEVWRALRASIEAMEQKEHYKYDIDGIIRTMDKNKIEWLDSKENLQTMVRRTFDNLMPLFRKKEKADM